MPPSRNAATAILSSAPSRLSGVTSTTMSRPYVRGRRRRSGGGAKDRARRTSALPSAPALCLSPDAGDPGPARSAVGPGGGATGTIRSEFELARIAGADGSSAAVQVRGVAAAGASSFFAVFGIPRGRRFPEAAMPAAPGEASGELRTLGVVSGPWAAGAWAARAWATGAAGGRTGGAEVCLYQYTEA